MPRKMKTDKVRCPVCEYVSGRVSVPESSCTMWQHMRDCHFSKDFGDVWRHDGEPQWTHIQCACGWKSKEMHHGLLLCATLLYDHWCCLTKEETDSHRILFAMGVQPRLFAEKEQPCDAK